MRKILFIICILSIFTTGVLAEGIDVADSSMTVGGTVYVSTLNGDVSFIADNTDTTNLQWYMNLNSPCNINKWNTPIGWTDENEPFSYDFSEQPECTGKIKSQVSGSSSTWNIIDIKVGPYYLGGTGNEFDGMKSTYKTGDCKFSWGIFNCDRKNSELLKCKGNDMVVDGRSKSCERGIFSCKTDNGAKLICKEFNVASSPDESEEDSGELSSEPESGLEKPASVTAEYSVSFEKLTVICAEVDGATNYNFAYYSGGEWTWMKLPEYVSSDDTSSNKAYWVNFDEEEGKAVTGVKCYASNTEGSGPEIESAFRYTHSVECNDNDDFDTSTKGLVSLTDTSGDVGIVFESHRDSCDGSILTEWSCTTNNQADSDEVTCEYGCSDGACLGPPADSDAPSAPTKISAKQTDANTVTIRCSGAVSTMDDGILNYYIGTYYNDQWSIFNSQSGTFGSPGGLGYYQLDTSRINSLTRVRCRVADSRGAISNWVTIGFERPKLEITNIDHYEVRPGSEYIYDSTFSWRTDVYADSKVTCRKTSDTISSIQPVMSSEKVKIHELTVKGLTKGNWDCIIQSLDLNGEYSAEETVEVGILMNNNPPTITSFNLASDYSTFGGEQKTIISMNCRADDPDNNQEYYTLMAKHDGKWETLAEDVTSGYYRWDVSELDSQTGVQLKCFATDKAETSEDKTILGIIIDQDAPTITVDKAEVSSLGFATVALTASEYVTYRLTCPGTSLMTTNHFSPNHTFSFRSMGGPQQADPNAPGGGSISAQPFTCTANVFDKVGLEATKSVQVIVVEGGSVEIGGGAAVGGGTANPFRAGPSGGIGAAGGIGFKGEEQYDDGVFMQYWDMVFTVFPFLAP